jgi:Cys-tRNA(Pro)/Cys-tRNA(Cys) deacylase
LIFIKRGEEKNIMRPNNVTRLLDSRKIHYKAYELSPEKRGAGETARILGVPEEEVFKTIVIKRVGNGKPILALIPGPYEVDIKSLANELGEKKLYLASEKEAEMITGLQAGGISPLALINRGFQVVIDSSASLFENIHVSGGQRGLSIRLSPQDLSGLTNARFVDILAGH